MEIKSILFPTDFSEGSLVASPYALDMARKYNAKVYIMHVIFDIRGSAGLYGSHISTDVLYEEIKKSAEKELELCANDFAKDYNNIEKVLQVGTPYEDILNFAYVNNIDLIILGSHSRKGLGRVLFGSTATRVVKQAHCPVLTVRVPAE